MDVDEILKSVEDDVRRCVTEGEFREAAYRELLAYRLRTHGDVTGVTANTRETSAIPEGTSAIARRLGVEPEPLLEIYDVSGDAPTLIAAPSRLPVQKSRATRLIALLLVAGRQAEGVEEWTPTGVIRDECRRYGVLDGPNFAGDIAALGEYFGFRGQPRSREAKMNLRGFEAAGREVLRLTEREAA
jgi:hypothetical protein